MQRADDAAGNRVFISVGVSHRHDRFSDHQIARGADRNHGEFFWAVDLDHGQIVDRIGRHFLGDEIAAAAQGDFDLLHAIDDVEVGENIASFVDHHACAHAVDASRALAVDRRIFAGVERLLAVNVHDRIAHRFDGPHDRSAAVVGSANPRNAGVREGRHAQGRQRQASHSSGDGRQHALRSGSHSGLGQGFGIGGARGPGSVRAAFDSPKVFIGLTMEPLQSRWCRRNNLPNLTRGTVISLKGFDDCKRPCRSV